MEYRFKWVKTETTTATDIVTSAADPKLIHAQCVSFGRQKMAEIGGTPQTCCDTRSYVGMFHMISRGEATMVIMELWVSTFHHIPYEKWRNREGSRVSRPHDSLIVFE